MNEDLSRVSFGSSGVRGLVEDLTNDVCFAYTLSFLMMIKSREKTNSLHKIAIGCDLRPSSERITQACIAAIKSMGYEADFIGVVPTPALALHALQEKIPAIMITGSHIPFDRNGLKFYVPEGEILKSDEAAILRTLSSLPDTWRDQVRLSPLPERNPQALDSYLARYLGVFPNALLAQKRIGIYQHSSVARDLLVELITALGGEAVPLERSDSFVPIDTEALQPDLQKQAWDWAKTHRLDAVLSTDGDADRPLIGDETGTFLRGDEVGILTALFLNADVVVTPLSSNTALERLGVFQKVTRTRIGSPFVIEEMLTERAAAPEKVIVGFEANGGVLTQTPVTVSGISLPALPTRDAILPILSLLTMAQQRGAPLSNLRTLLPPRFTLSGRLAKLSPNQVTDLKGLLATPETLGRILDRGPAAETNGLDGARFTYDDDVIIHLRLSGNAPELRCYVETNSSEESQEILKSSLYKVSTILEAAGSC